MSKIAVAVFNRKGGVGKTTISVILAQLALIKHNRVLAVDVDPSRNFTDALSFMKNYFRDSLRLKDTLEATDADSPEELIVIDCPPSLGNESKQAIDFADIIVTPVRPDFFSISSLAVLYKVADELGKDKAQLPLVKVGYDNSMMSRIAMQVITDKEYPVAEDLPLHKRIPYNIANGLIWSTGLTAHARKPYEDLYDKMIRAVEKLKGGITDIREVWKNRKDGE